MSETRRQEWHEKFLDILTARPPGQLMRVIRVLPLSIINFPFFRRIPVDDWRELVKKIDQSDHTVTDWEAGFLESLLRRRELPTPRQLAILLRMVEQYLGAELAAEFRGQQRLW